MAISLENLSSISSLDQLRLDGGGQLEKRSALGTIGHKIMDAFRSLSAEGRTAIASRNTALLSAMLDAVDASRTSGDVGTRGVEASLSKTLERLSAANTASYGKALAARIMSDPNVAAMPEASRGALQYGLATIASENPRDEWQSLMNGLRDTFLGRGPEGFSLERGVQKFGNDLRSLFFSAHATKLDEHGVHGVFYRDMERGSVKSVGGKPIDGVQIKKVLPDIKEYQQAYRAVLTDFLKDSSPDKVDSDMRFLPFLSIACTQNGAASTCPLLAGASGHDAVRLFLQSGINSPIGSTSHSTTISRDSENPRHILIQATASQLYSTIEAGSSPALKLETSITMRIDLDAEPTEKEVNGKQIFLPSFTLENASTRFTTEGL
ncbi:MAG: hypothetical protein IKJ34_07415 [Mailhella sp.]|nr:hypothetical protein [Mailhella sp.]